MTNKRIDINLSPSGTLIMLIISGILGYFVYDYSIEAAIGITGLTMVIGLVFILSLIPILGWITAIGICHFWVIPGMLEIIGLEYTWLITIIFVIWSLTGLVITCMMLLVVGVILSR